ncbi:MAG: SoxR reducing system RseC family protein [Bacillota bacterium]
MKEIGTVVKADKKNIKIRMERKSACGNCNMCGFKQGDMHVDLNCENKLGAKLGDKVEMEMEASTVLISASIVYLVPLICALVGFLIAYLLGVSELAQFGGLMAGVAFGFLVIFIIDKLVKKTKFTPTCTRIVKEDII